LPDGDGKQVVQTVCAGATRLITPEAGDTIRRVGWLIATMIALPPETENQISTYLAQHFSANRVEPLSSPARRRSTFRMAAPRSVRFRTILAASDGSIWWTA
jgi:hypothetical protein